MTPKERRDIPWIILGAVLIVIVVIAGVISGWA
jgi:hypothetical protein